MACEITAVNDDLDDETSAFIEKHASILDEDDPFLCFIDVLDDHRAIFRSMDQLSRLSFTSTMIPFFPPLPLMFALCVWAYRQESGRSSTGGSTSGTRTEADQHIQIACSVPSCMHIAEENHLSDFQVHFLKEHAQCGKREVFLEFFNRAEEDDLVFHDLDHISTFKNSMLDEFCKLFGHLGFSSGALPSSTLLKGIIESLQKGCSPAVSRDRIATTLHHLILATLRHPQLTTLLTLQLRQNVFLRVPINVVGDRDVSIPDSRSRVRSRSPKHADARGFASPLGQEGCAYGGNLHTEVACLPACPGGDAAPASAPCRLGAGPGGMEGDQGAVCAGSPCSNQAGCGQTGGERLLVVAREHYRDCDGDSAVTSVDTLPRARALAVPKGALAEGTSPATDQHIQIACSVPSCMHIAEENHLSDFQAHFLKEHAQCGKREVFLEFFNRAEEDDLVFHDLDHISCVCVILFDCQ
ncbi:hypothetical protein PAPYR_10849 [Paratrimastix pyriformis]|uniref:Uncharacterized protein n=1 Tax=Paratrimastix pyriformis TaxID=342808 RepID=A0ABQ8UCA8_9EUKA|nr:hypothetical protein PAPYR_10849 [Paratrimastix pyriformis]